MATLINTPTDPRFQDITGQRFGRWVVIGMTNRRPSKWLCKCDCGSQMVIPRGNLAGGKTKSCGCSKGAYISAARSTHGASKTPLYQTWCGIVARCTNEGHESFQNYGGRGIEMCARWRDGDGAMTGFECFRLDMGPRPSPWHTVERDNNNGDYEPSNCRWATRREQSRNTRRNHFVSFEGKAMPLFDALKSIGLDNTTYYRRIARGWSEYDALHTPVDVRHHRKSKR